MLWLYCQVACPTIAKQNKDLKNLMSFLSGAETGQSAEIHATSECGSYSPGAYLRALESDFPGLLPFFTKK
ncbi:MAG TPA: hypothetical protein DDY45_15675 [Verrucomicrobiales bacterium]|nr:hypothetical protein [Verrucomicrobiales bacterium]